MNECADSVKQTPYVEVVGSLDKRVRILHERIAQTETRLTVFLSSPPPETKQAPEKHAVSPAVTDLWSLDARLENCVDMLSSLLDRLEV